MSTLELQEGEFAIGEIPDELEARMDPGHLHQVLWNLCDNAVKYASETGGILVEIQAGRMQGQGDHTSRCLTRAWRRSGDGRQDLRAILYGALRRHGSWALYIPRIVRTEPRNAGLS